MKANINIKMDSSLRDKANLILDNIGLSPSAFVVMAYKQLVRQRRIPFEIVVNEEELRKELSKSIYEASMNDTSAKRIVIEEDGEYDADKNSEFHDWVVNG